MKDYRKINSYGPILPCKNQKLRLGILGGSFDPPHEGHLHATIIAAKRLSLDRVIWVVTPQSPGKIGQKPQPLEQRISKARELVEGQPLITVTSIEERIGRNYTYYVLKFLRNMHHGDELFWIMGADNLWSFPQWKRWQEITQYANIVVVDRRGMLLNWHKSKLASHLKINDDSDSDRESGIEEFSHHADISSSPHLIVGNRKKENTLTIIKSKNNDLSSTAIREEFSYKGL